MFVGVARMKVLVNIERILETVQLKTYLLISEALTATKSSTSGFLAIPERATSAWK